MGSDCEYHAVAEVCSEVQSFFPFWGKGGAAAITLEEHSFIDKRKEGGRKEEGAVIHLTA